MASVFDVAEYILSQEGETSAMKLQKLVYYSQAWHLVGEDEPIFDADFEAWANGPVVKELYDEHQGMVTVPPGHFEQGDAGEIEGRTKEIVDKIVDFYGEKESFVLSELTHEERPWKETRGSLPEGARSRRTIPQSTMKEYYESLL